MRDRLLDDVRAGATRWLVFTGPAGIGKSRLAQERAARLRSPAGREVWARCPEEDGAPAWWPMRQLVRGLGADPDAVLVPPPGADPDEARFAVYERLLGLLESVASGAGGSPLTLVIDDIQWADPTSVRCLALLAGALQDQPIALVVTLRDGAAGPEVQRLLGALARTGGNRQIAVPALSADEVNVLASRIAGEQFSGPQARLLASRTGGNPLFVSEYARLPLQERLGDGIPVAVRSVLGRRLAGLEPAVLQVLRAAAVIGDVLEVDVLAATTRLDVDTLADHLDDAADHHIIVTAPGTGGDAFAHGLLREEVLAGLPALRRQRLHARVAAVLADSSGSDRLSRRAQHLISALPLADPAQVLAACVAAAEDASDRWSSESAALARERLAAAVELCERNGGEPTLLRCRLLAAELEPGALQQQLLLEAVATDAVRLGMMGVEGDARRLMVPASHG